MTAESRGARGAVDRPTGFTIGEAAARVGVTASTLRSWDARYGLGPGGRSAGGHRRYTLSDIARLQRVRRLMAAGMPAADAVATTGAPAASRRRGAALRRLRPVGGDDDAVRRLVAAADALDSPRIARALDALLTERGVIRTWTEVIVPLLQQVGGYWLREDDGVDCEHVMTDVVQAVLLTHSWKFRQAAAPGPVEVVLAGVPDDAHVLPLHAASAALAERGFRVRVLGAVPMRSLFSALEQLTPTAVVLWARTRHTADRALLREVASRAPLVCAAGGWPAKAVTCGVRSVDLVTTVRAVSDWIRPGTLRP